ncbi:MAG TPA: hypothetical protein VK255_02710 [Patescibacteria group bacterium]|nr:hypothetical protein [Patescibacteria group bacterium]
MKKNKIIVATLLVILLFVFWAPWVTDSYAKKYIKNTESFAHLSLGHNNDLNTAWVPFGRNVYTTFDKNYYVNFLGFSFDIGPGM